MDHKNFLNLTEQLKPTILVVNEERYGSNRLKEVL